jgi:hypothetical protein
MRKQYYFRPSGRGYRAWDVDRLVTLTQDFPRIHVALSDICELDEAFPSDGISPEFVGSLFGRGADASLVRYAAGEGMIWGLFMGTTVSVFAVARHADPARAVDSQKQRRGRSIAKVVDVGGEPVSNFIGEHGHCKQAC